MTGESQVYAVLGDPVHHSLSPQIQNAAFRAAGMNAVYVALEVPASRLPQALEGLHAAGARGLNLTTPHKEAAFGLARRTEQARVITALTPEGDEAQAINTLRLESNGWKGHATDGLGFLNWVGEAGFDLRKKRILVLGAGGAARAIVAQLPTLLPESVHIVSRDPAHADALARHAPMGSRVKSAGLGDSTADAPEGKGWQVIIRALAIETISEEEEHWWRGHEKGALVLDLNYGARALDARALAAAHRLQYEDGGALLVHQGAASFEFWTGTKAPLSAMREALAAAGG